MFVEMTRRRGRSRALITWVCTLSFDCHTLLPCFQTQQDGFACKDGGNEVWIDYNSNSYLLIDCIDYSTTRVQLSRETLQLTCKLRDHLRVSTNLIQNFSTACSSISGNSSIAKLSFPSSRCFMTMTSCVLVAVLRFVLSPLTFRNGLANSNVMNVFM